MSVYSKDGIKCDLIYDIAGTAIEKAYDKSGAVVFEKGYAIDNVISYYQEPTLLVADDINSLGDEWQSVVFITDPHGSENQQHSQAIALYLLANTKIKFVVLGGDYTLNNWSLTQYQTWVSPFVNSGFLDKIYAVYGNHETFSSNGTFSETQAESMNAIHTDFVRKKNVTGQKEQLYYYFDDAANKTRFMIINTSDADTCTMSDTQIEWIKSNVVLPTTEWHLVVFGHVNIDDLGVTEDNATNAEDIIEAIAECNGSIVGYICGHQHIDAISNTGKFYQATLLNDKLENANWYPGLSVTDRSEGTVTEQAVSVVSFNTTAKDVVIRRIGAGRNSTLSYNYAQS